jgi:hypothetical protein
MLSQLLKPIVFVNNFFWKLEIDFDPYLMDSFDNYLTVELKENLLDSLFSENFTIVFDEFDLRGGNMFH